MQEKRFLFKCDVCDQLYQHGPHRYEGHKLSSYGDDIFACNSCWRANHDGWAPHYEAVLLGHLYRHGLPVPQRNEKGLLPRV